MDVYCIQCHQYHAVWKLFMVLNFNFLTVLKLRSRATRTLVSMLVRFLRRRAGKQSNPRDGEDRELGLGKVLSIDMVSESSNNDMFVYWTYDISTVYIYYQLVHIKHVVITLIHPTFKTQPLNLWRVKKFLLRGSHSACVLLSCISANWLEIWPIRCKIFFRHGSTQLVAPCQHSEANVTQMLGAFLVK